MRKINQGLMRLYMDWDIARRVKVDNQQRKNLLRGLAEKESTSFL